MAITNSRATAGTQTFLNMDHVEDRRVFVNYDLGAAATIIAPTGNRFHTQIGVPVRNAKTVRTVRR